MSVVAEVESLHDEKLLMESAIKRRSSWRNWRQRLITILSLAVATMLGIVIGLGFEQKEHQQQRTGGYIAPLAPPVSNHEELFGLPSRVRRPFTYDFNNLDEREHEGYKYADEHWENLFPHGGGLVALSPDVAQAHGLPQSMPSLMNSSETVYLLAGYHQLHCLDVIRHSLYDFHLEKDPPDYAWSHMIHCVESIRQALICNLDVTLLSLEPGFPGVPSPQMHACRNVDGINQWLLKHPGWDEEAYDRAHNNSVSYHMMPNRRRK